MRAGDAVNLAAGLWFVPRLVAHREIGAVLPVTSFATLVAMPVFALALVVAKESADLRGRGETGRLKSLLRGVFIGIAALAALGIASAALLMPRFAARMGVAGGPAVPLLAVAGAILGCCAPVCTDALQGLKRFGALAGVEFASAMLRLATLAVAMPFRPLAGYFAGSVAQPLVRAAGSVAALRRELAVPAEPYWTLAAARTLAARFALTALYVMLPMAVGTQELAAVRTLLTADESAGYYLATRLTDLLGYLTTPVLLVLFPYAADAAREGRPTRPLVLRCWAATGAAALALGALYCAWGETFLGWIPGGREHADFAGRLPVLLAIGALTAAQTFQTNAEVAAGRFGFLRWFAPLNLAFAAFWACADFSGSMGADGLLRLFLVGAILRFAFAAADLCGDSAGRAEAER